MPDRQFVGTALIAGVHGLRSAQIVGDFLLCPVVVFS